MALPDRPNPDRHRAFAGGVRLIPRGGEEMYAAVLASKVLRPLLLTLALRLRGVAGASTGGRLYFIPSFSMRSNASTSSAFAVLPRAPRNASPVPGLTSLYHKAARGNYGDARYPGNCGG